MRSWRALLCLTMACSGFLCGGGVRAETIGAPVKLSSRDVRLNDVTIGGQLLKPITGGAVGALADGSYVVAWTSTAGSGTAIRARRVSATGEPVGGADIPVSIYTSASRFHPVVAPVGTGFVVAWFGGGPGDFVGIFARRFDSAGQPLDASEVRLNTATGDNQSMVAVAPLASGGYVAVWSGLGPVGGGVGYGVFARRFAASGAPLDSVEVPVNAAVGGDSNPSVAALPGGGYVVTWMTTSDGDANGIRARRFAETGEPIDTADIPVNANITGLQADASVAGRPDGGFVATWVSANQDGSSDGVFARRFGADGAPLDANDIQVNFEWLFGQFAPSVVTLDDGSFVVAFATSEEPDGGGPGIRIRRFAASGVPLDPTDVPVNTTAAGFQGYPSIALLPDGSTVAVVWEGQGPGDGLGIFSNRLRVRGAPVARADRATVVAGGTVGIQVLNNDADADAGDALFVVRATPTVGTATVLDRRRVRYTAPSAGAGITLIRYVVRDRAGNRAMGTVSVTILPPATVASQPTAD
jgi:hypothetical protein